MAKKITYADIFDLSNSTDLNNAIKAISKLDKVYKDLEKSISSGSKNIQTAIKGTVKAADGLEKEIKQLSEVNKEDQKQIQKLNAQIKALNAAYEAQKKELAALSAQEKKLSTERKQVAKANADLNKQEQQRIKLEQQLAKATSKDAQETARLKVQIQEANKATKEKAKESLGLVSIYQKESARLNDLRKRYKDVSLQQGANSKAAKNLAKEANVLDKRLKSLDSSVGQNQRNVGNYGDALTSVNPAITTVINQVKVFSKVLLASPIGLIVTALAALVGAFLSTQRGADALNKVLKPLGFLFDSLIGVVQDLSFKAFDGLAEAIENPTQAFKDLGDIIVRNLLNRFKSFQVFLESITLALKGEWTQALKTGADAVALLTLGVEDFTDKTEDASKAVIEFGDDALEAGSKLEELERSLEVLRIQLTVPLAKAQNEYRRLDGIAKDNLKTEEERIEAYNKAEEQLRFIIAAEQKQLKLELEIAELKATANDTDRDAQLEIEKIKANIINAETSGQKRVNTLIAARSALEKKQVLEAQKQLPKLNQVRRAGAKDIKDITDQLNEDIKEGQRQELQNFKKLEEDKTRIAKEEEENRRVIRESAFEAANLIGNQLFTNAQIRSENELVNFRRQKEVELELAGENAQARAAIEQQIADKEKEIKIKQSKENKKQALFNIALNTAQGVTAALTSVPPNVPLSISIAAIGALQAGLVASQPLPQFEDGGFKDMTGDAIVGEKGYEYSVSPSGKLTKVGQKGAEVRSDIEKGSFIIPHHVSKALDDYGLNANGVYQESTNSLKQIIDARQDKMAMALVNAFARENDILAERFDKSIKNVPQTEWNISDRKLKNYVVEGNTRRSDWRSKNKF